MARHLDAFNHGANSYVSLLDCMTMLRAAWEAVPAELICKCFEKCSFRTTDAVEHAKHSAPEDTNSEAQDLWQEGKAAG